MIDIPYERTSQPARWWRWITSYNVQLFGWLWDERNVSGRNSPQENSSHELTPSEWSDWSEEGNLPAGCRGIVNPNYPGFQHLAPSLLSDTDLTEDEHDSCSDSPSLHHHDEVSPTRLSDNDNEYNNNIDDSINHLCGQRNDRKIFYEKPKFNIQVLQYPYHLNELIVLVTSQRTSRVQNY